MNPKRFRPFYSDKNMYDLVMDISFTPKTYIRRINGSNLLGEDYKPIQHNIDDLLKTSKGIILKPSIDTAGGLGVCLFERNDDGMFVNKKTKETLSSSFLLNSGKNFIVQEAVVQSSSISIFCKTAINTLRISVYRSVKDESLNILGCVLRIGKQGEIVDNSHSGGRFVAVDINTGRVGKQVFDIYGNHTNSWNEVDFSASEYTIPNLSSVIEFAKKVCDSNHHCRLFALDIALCHDNSPVLIEYNVEGFAYWLFQYSGQLALGKFSEEIISYCKKNKSLNIG